MTTDTNNIFARFEYREFSQEIIDNLTGYTYYCNNKEIVKLLNQMDARANSNVEQYYDLLKKEKKERSFPKIEADNYII